MTPPWEAAPSGQPELALAPEADSDDMPPYDDYVPAESYEDYGSFEPAEESQAPLAPEPAPTAVPVTATATVAPAEPSAPAPAASVPAQASSPAALSAYGPSQAASEAPEGLSAEERRVFQVVEAAFGSEVRVLPADPTNPLSQ